MKHKNTINNIKELESNFNGVLKKLKTLSILKTKGENYTKKDKEEFVELWTQFIIYFDELKSIIKKHSYRRFFVIANYNNMIVTRYTCILYYNSLVKIIDLFGKHEDILRQLLLENYKKSYGYYAKNIYKAKYINLMNTPNIFLYSVKIFIDKDLYFMMGDNVQIDVRKKIFLDYTNVYFYIKRRIENVLLFLSKYSGKIIAKTRFTSRKKGLISKKSLNKYLEIAKPGDIILTRGNWNASNIIIPGFWKHMSMYIGKIKDDDKHYIIEATGEGIKVVDINNFRTKDDYMGISRTNFSKEKIKRTIKNAMSHIGKEYDHIFNFHSDKALVCSELVLKSYSKKNENDTSIEINLERKGLSLAYPPNNFVKELEKESHKKDPTIFPVMFIDSTEKNLKNFINTNDEFLKSYKRSRLSMFLK